MNETSDASAESEEQKVARPKRFELLTPRFVVWCSIQLSYGRRFVQGVDCVAEHGAQATQGHRHHEAYRLTARADGGKPNARSTGSRPAGMTSRGSAGARENAFALLPRFRHRGVSADRRMVGDAGVAQG